jgi:uncharacterized protein (TIGR02145 family)
MKTIKTSHRVSMLILLLLFSPLLGLYAQSTEKMNYQAVIRNTSDSLVTKTQIGMKISILQGSADGVVVYSEIQTPVTNLNGMISIEIGGETGFSAIDWSAGPFFIKTETAIESPLTNYTHTETNQIMSVPYAIAASAAYTINKLTPGDASACDESSEGSLRYNTDTHSVEYCNGINWIPLLSGLSINLPKVNTQHVTAITTNSARSGGSIFDNGGAEIIQKGVCWSTGALPTISNSTTLNGAGNASFASNLTGLDNNTLYFTRAYATNTSGAGYGEERNFTTQASLTTREATERTLTSFVTGGEIDMGGGQSISERGVVYGTSANPTILNNKVIASEQSTGGFSVAIDNLPHTNKYYYKAYAINAGGLNYGNEYSTGYFDTAGAGFTDSRDGTSYATVWIGGREWMAENLKYLPSVVGITESSFTIPFYYTYGYDGTNVSDAKNTSNYHEYGVLYNWPAAMNSCPQGWHLPKTSEWAEMEQYLIANGYNFDDTKVGNKIAKSMATASGWSSHVGTGNVGNADYPEKQNASGFSALPAGDIFGHSAFNGLGLFGRWWTASEHSNSSLAWCKIISNNSIGVTSEYFNFKKSGFSVRCVRD